MTGKEIEKAVECRSTYDPDCSYCPDMKIGCANNFPKELCDYSMRLKLEKQTAETQLKEILSALYQRTDKEQGLTLYRKDIVELAKDYGIREEELK